MTKRIHVRSANTSVDVDDVYFTFGNGRLAYDCVTCGSKCCRGFEYAVNRGPEILYQLSSRPHVRFFVEEGSNGDATQWVKNAPPGCFFLRSDGLCGIHAERGYHAKPETCRFFPFNALTVLGRYLIVSPHAQLCPLEVAPTGTISTCSEYSSLLDNMAVQGVGGNVTRCETHLNDHDTAIALERRIVALSEHYLENGSIIDYVDAQNDATGASLHLEGHNADPRNVQAQLKRMADVLGVSVEDLLAPDAEVRRLIVAVTPYLRSQFVFRSVDRKAERSALPVVDLSRLPYMSLAMFVIIRLAKLAGMTRATFQTVSKLLADYRQLIGLLAHLDAVVVWRRDRLLELLLPAGQKRFQTGYLKVACSG